MLHIRDDFEDARRAGGVLGTRATSGAIRRGVDVERRIAIDHGALRFQPMLWDGWGRQGIAYGPLAAGEPWALSVGLLNGHNASHGGHLEQTYGARLATWLRAGGSQRSRERLRRWLCYGQRQLTLRQFATWLLRDPRLYGGAPLEETLAVGFGPSVALRAPAELGAGFSMRSSRENNGDLCVRSEGNELPVLRGVPNVPLLLVIVQWGEHALYFVSSAEGEVGGRYPRMRPVGLTGSSPSGERFAGIHQSVLGEIGFRVDSRVYGVRVARGVEMAPFAVHDAASGGGSWELPAAAGLAHLVLDLAKCPTLSVSFGGDDREEEYVLVFRPGRLSLKRAFGGASAPLAERAFSCSGAAGLQLLALEDGVHVVVDGVRCFEPVRLGTLTRLRVEPVRPARLEHVVRHVMAVPRDVPIPDELRVTLPRLDPGGRVCVEELFEGAPAELHRTTLRSGQRWRKELGDARLLLDPGGGVKVHDARSLTSRGRTIYTVPWYEPDFAELEIRVMPPGQRQGQGEEGRAGVVFWQDADNYLIIGTWLNDAFGGASISSFYCLGGFEDIYDAVWTNVGQKIRWGSRYRLRVSFDGGRLTAYLDGRGVLHRAISDVHRRIESLRIQRVGVVSNWEWGNDTGSVIEAFVARSGRAPARPSRRIVSGRVLVGGGGRDVGEGRREEKIVGRPDFVDGAERAGARRHGRA